MERREPKRKRARHLTRAMWCRLGQAVVKGFPACARNDKVVKPLAGRASAEKRERLKGRKPYSTKSD